MSKAHPERSKVYKQKLLVRDRRQVERQLLKKAKEAYIKMHPEVLEAELTRDPMRSQIAQLKNKAKKAILGPQPQNQILEELPQDVEEMLHAILIGNKGVKKL